MLAREVRILFDKEWRQLVRSRSAMLTALILPLLLLVIIPGLQIVALSAGAPPGMVAPPGGKLPPGLEVVAQDPKALLGFTLLPLLALGALVVPTVTASYAITSEREARTLELLVALPVRVGQILLAKLLAILAITSIAIVGFFAVDAVLLLTLEMASVGYVLALLAMLLSALAFSTAFVLLVSLLARDFRTANNISGLLVGPTVFVTLGLVLGVPGPTRAAVLLAGLYAVGAVVATFIAMRVVTFERLLR
jgi:ABC-type Na+ efflux pump permease subunit